MHYQPTITARDPLTRLLWASLNVTAAPVFVWEGFGLLSDEGLPFDSLQMALAAKELAVANRLATDLVVLLADEHACSTGSASSVVARRAARRSTEMRAICELLRLPVRVLLASELGRDPLFANKLGRARQWASGARQSDAPPPAEYTIRAIADDLYFASLGGVKVGWSRASTISPGRGRHHEPEVDLLASTLDPAISAVYVRAGVTLDSKRPAAVPYTEFEPASRLMLTGPHRGDFARKLAAPDVSPKRARAVAEHIELTVEAFEKLIGQLDGGDVVEKAEDLVARLTRLIPRDSDSANDNDSIAGSNSWNTHSSMN